MSETSHFLWCAGIENTFIAEPGTETGKTLDEYELTDHYGKWKGDIALAASLGINSIRWGIPWYRVERNRGTFDWGWVDDVIGALTERHGVTPIVDLIHYGTPLWLNDALLDQDFLPAFLDYTRAFCERYSPRVAYATPVNEPYTAAEFCGRRGDWPPYRKSDSGFAAVMLATSRAAVESSRILKEFGMTTVHVEVATGALAAEPSAAGKAEFHTRKNELYWDLITGRVDAQDPMREWLLSNGAAEAEIDWFLENGDESLIDIQGINYYPQWSYVAMLADGTPLPLNGGVRLLETHLRRFWAKYHLPMMITETSVRGGNWEKSGWLNDSVECIRRLRAEGVSIEGYTWFPVIDMVDWEYRNTDLPVDDYRMELGLITLEREERASTDTYRTIIRRGMDD